MSTKKRGRTRFRQGGVTPILSYPLLCHHDDLFTSNLLEMLVAKLVLRVNLFVATSKSTGSARIWGLLYRDAPR